MNFVVGIITTAVILYSSIYPNQINKATVPQTETAIEQQMETETERESEATTENVSEQESESQTESLSEQGSETESASEKLAETESESAAEKLSEQETEATTEKATEPESESETEKLTEIESESTSETLAETETETATEKLSEQGTEGVTETASELESESASEKLAETGTENQSESETATESETETAKPGHQIENFPIIMQMPELPTGCEITAMTMALRYAGYDVSKVDMALKYLPRTGFEGAPDMDRYFVGDPAGEGITCGNLAVETAVNEYFKTITPKHIVKAIKGISTEEVLAYIDRDIPVVIWCTIGMGDREGTQGWYTEDGRYMEWSHNDHGAVLIGYDENQVTIADPICDKITCSREQFEKIFTARGRQCVVLIERTEEAVKEELGDKITSFLEAMLLPAQTP